MANSRGKTILLVDDEEQLRDAIAFDLNDAGYKTLTAKGGNEAFRIIEKTKVDLVVSDIRMPDGNGVQLLDKVKEGNPEVPVVLFITGFGDISEEEAYDKGAEALIAKPFDTEVLIAAIEKALTAPRLRWGQRPERFEIDLDVKLKFPGYSQAVSAKALNIGRGGMFLYLTDDLPDKGDIVSFEVSFDAKNDAPIIGSGEVRWVRTTDNENYKRGVGLEFVQLSPATIEKIVQLIASLKPKAFIPR